MGWLRRKNRPQKEDPNDSARSYYARPTVPPESLYPLLKRVFNQTFMFVGLGPRVMAKGGNDPEDTRRFAEAVDKAVEEFDADFADLRNAAIAVEVVRVADSDEHIMGVQIVTEYFMRSVLRQYHHEASAFIAMVEGDQRKHEENRKLAEYYENDAAQIRPKFGDAIRELHRERPDQFQDFGLSENDLIDLGVADLAQ